MESAITTDPLLPCFCNGEGFVTETQFTVNYPTSDTTGNNHFYRYNVICNFCYAQTPFVNHRETAIKAWNAMIESIKSA